MSLRADHRALTSRKILGAVLDLVADGEDRLSVPAVAARSGVSVPTIYRYYGTKDELLAAAAAEPARLALENVEPHPVEGDAFAAVQDAMWREFVKNMPLLRHQAVSESGREMRAVRLESSRRQLAAYLADQGIDPASEGGERLISLLLLVSGSLALVELHDRQGLDVDDALETSLWAARALIDATRGVATAATTKRGRR